jgi:hypothetical protein
LKIDKYKISPKEWTWNKTSSGYEGVHTREQKLVWFIVDRNTIPERKVVSQSYEAFVKDGPPYDNVPFDVMIELYEKILYAVETTIR